MRNEAKQALVMLRRQEVERRTGLGRSELYRQVALSVLPQPIRRGVRGVAWPAHEIDIVLEARMAGASNDELRAIVGRLHAERQAAPALRRLMEIQQGGRPALTIV